MAFRNAMVVYAVVRYGNYLLYFTFISLCSFIRKGLEKVVVAETGECCKVKDIPIAHLITPVQHQLTTTIRSPQTLSCEIRVSSESTLETSFAQGP
jgi:ethanolamine ammonia-lyase large subunit